MNALVTLSEICRLAGCSDATLRSWRRAGLFPNPTHQRGRNKFWLREVAESAIAGLTRRIN